ncbi:hypothetical protein Z517_09265 [Fonsecaea pedrosoi CBS 271.37]|uniref:Uncharacterized protein n=1 Tax=Fonsecaea pedrosoi CBS 271.37 TaxID=1442368 RepID=A0A0D2DGK3_9EURO|nr:uncharacterized protein Z517_09265 [Fonsecaea pedrosoi CBS 271.37]KIW76821.1 hypothetical protein Z517_09265 [Fonsecaea pedrosoi CBS 271.37]
MSKSRNVHAHERVPTHWTMIPTTVEEMNTGSAGILTSKTNPSHSEVVCGIMADIMCLIEIGMTYEKSLGDSFNMICLNVVSGRAHGHHQGHMCLSEQLYPVATTVLMANRHINIDWPIRIARLTTTRAGSNVVIMTSVSMEPSDALQMMNITGLIGVHRGAHVQPRD